MRAKDEVKLNVLRQLKNSITNAALTKGNVNTKLSNDEIVSLIRKQIKQREDSVAFYVKGNRLDLTLQEEAEIKILKEYLPTALSKDELDQIIKQAIRETGAISKKEMGKAIKRAQELAAGRIDNKTISIKIGELL